MTEPLPHVATVGDAKAAARSEPQTGARWLDTPQFTSEAPPAAIAARPRPRRRRAVVYWLPVVAGGVLALAVKLLADPANPLRQLMGI